MLLEHWHKNLKNIRRIQWTEEQTKVKVVKNFADFKVKKVSSFPDIEVKKVNNFPDDCGEWKFVDSFPDFTIQYVDSFPDFTIRMTDSFPGVK